MARFQAQIDRRLAVSRLLQVRSMRIAHRTVGFPVLSLYCVGMNITTNTDPPAEHEPTLSHSSQQALTDMIELNLYLVAQPQQRPWPMMPRGKPGCGMGRLPYCNPIESASACE